MLGLALLFLLIALGAYFLGEGRVGAAALDIAKWCFVIFVVLLVLSLVLGMVHPGPYWYYPVPYRN